MSCSGKITFINFISFGTKLFPHSWPAFDYKTIIYHNIRMLYGHIILTITFVVWLLLLCSKQSHHHHPPLNVIIKNPLMEHLSHSSQSPSSIDSLPSQPPPMYHTVYASETTASADSPFFSIHPCQTRSNSNTDTATPLHLLMDVSSYYQHSTDKISNHSSSHTALIPSNYHHSQPNTIGSMTWSQAETLPLGGGSGSSRNGIDSHIGGFLSPTSPISTLSVPFTLQQHQQQHSQLLGSTMIMEEEKNSCESSHNQPITSETQETSTTV